MNRRAVLRVVMAAALGVAAVPGEIRAAPSAHVQYMLECQGCHLADGSGSPGAVPDLRDSLGRFLSVEGGRAFLVRVPGSAQSSLDDAELAAVLNWMLRRFGPVEHTGAFEPFDAAEVERHGRIPITDVEAVRSRLLAAIDAAEAHLP